MGYFQHPNIIGFREFYKTKKGNLCIVMDYADKGDMHKYLYKADARLKEAEILEMFVQIWIAIKYAHDMKVMHRDIKAQNIFLTKKGIVKLGDFGIAKVLSNTTAIAQTQVGSPWYLSPEIIANKPYKFSSDIWALGVLLFEMWSLEPPFKGATVLELFEIIPTGKYKQIPMIYSNELSDLIARMLRVDPQLRPSINEVLCHPAISQTAIEYLKGDQFRKEYLKICEKKLAAKASKEDQKELMSKTSKADINKMYETYIDKILEIFEPPEESKTLVVKKGESPLKFDKAHKTHST